MGHPEPGAQAGKMCLPRARAMDMCCTCNASNSTNRSVAPEKELVGWNGETLKLVDFGDQKQ